MKLFQLVKEIKSRSGELHFRRYAIIETKYFSIYIHRIFKEDKDELLHTHPWNFASIVISGVYAEQTDWEDRLKTVGSVSCAGRSFCHKILWVGEKPVTTLFVTFGAKRDWFYSKGKIHHQEFRAAKHATAPKLRPIGCNRCGRPVSNPLPDDTIVRAWVECPECIERKGAQ